MKRFLILLAVFTLFLGTGFSAELDSDAPEAGAIEEDTTVAVDDDTDVVIEAEVSDEGVDVNVTVVGEEEEILSTGGVVYFDGEIDYVSADVSFQIIAVDEGSGVKTINVKKDSGDSFEYTEEITFDTEASHSIAYNVEDNVGNISPEKSYKFIMDLTAPTLSLSTVQDVVVLDEVIYFNEFHEVKLSAVDNLSGVAYTKYSVDGGEEVTYTAAFIPEVADGDHEITYYSVDNVGNVTDMETYKFYKDSNAPTAKLSLDPLAFEKYDLNYISTSTEISFLSDDDETAVKKVFYSVNDSEYEEFFSSFTLTPGTYEISVYAVDILDNQSETVTYELIVDGSVPEADVVPIEK